MRTRLQYHDREFTLEPVNVSFATVVSHLKRTGKPIFVELEPGDATRYCLIVCLLGNDTGNLDILAVIRTNDFPLYSDSVGSAVVTLRDCAECSFEFEREIEHMSKGNPWTGEVLGWWVRNLALEVAA